MSSANRMVKTTAIYFVGNFASKLLTFFLLPIYAAFLNPDSFGTVDLVISTLPLIAPIFTLQSTESVFRFICGVESDKKVKMSISNALGIFGFGMTVFTILFIPISIISKYSNSVLLYLYFISSYVLVFSQQVTRGVKKNKEYAVAGVLTTIIQATLNIILIISFKMQAESLLISATVASIVISIFLIYKSNMWSYINFKLINKAEIKSQLKYGIPLIPNQICWWANSAFCKYVLLYFWGTNDTGIFAFSSKFPSLILTINSIFLLAFVENLIIEYKSPDVSSFFSKWFKLFLAFQIILVALLLPITKIYYIFTISSNYKTSILYVPILYLSSLFSALSSMIGSIYTASMKTVHAFTTTLVSACTNVILGVLLIPKLGIWGVCIANLISAIVFLAVRVVTIKKIMVIKYNVLELLPAIIILILSFVWYYIFGMYSQIIPVSLVAIFVFFRYRKELNLVLDLFRNKIKNLSGNG